MVSAAMVTSACARKCASGSRCQRRLARRKAKRNRFWILRHLSRDSATSPPARNCRPRWRKSRTTANRSAELAGAFSAAESRAVDKPADLVSTRSAKLMKQYFVVDRSEVVGDITFDHAERRGAAILIAVLRWLAQGRGNPCLAAI